MNTQVPGVPEEDSPLVSIITVCKNPGVLIRETFLSVTLQSYSNIEYIIIDGQSSDLTINWLTEPAQRCKISVLISETDNGIYSAINKGIRVASGTIIGIIHAGDTYEGDAISSVVSEYRKHRNQFRIIAGGMRLIYENGDNKRVLKLKKGSVERLRISMTLFHPSVFVAKSSYIQHGVFDETFKISGDYDLLRRFYIAGEKFLVLDKCLTSMRHGGISTQLRSLRLIVVEYGRARFGTEISPVRIVASIILGSLTLASMVKATLSRWRLPR